MTCAWRLNQLLIRLVLITTWSLSLMHCNTVHPPLPNTLLPCEGTKGWFCHLWPRWAYCPLPHTPSFSCWPSHSTAFFHPLGTCTPGSSLLSSLSSLCNFPNSVARSIISTTPFYRWKTTPPHWLHALSLVPCAETPVLDEPHYEVMPAPRSPALWQGQPAGWRAPSQFMVTNLKQAPRPARQPYCLPSSFPKPTFWNFSISSDFLHREKRSQENGGPSAS